MKVYKDKDASLDVLKGKTVAVIGFGIQGRAQAECMKDSGLNVIIGARTGGASETEAKKLGFTVLPVAKAAEKADIIHLLIPDPEQSKVYTEEIKPFLKSGKALSFSHGFNIAFKRITPPKDVDVFMVAPKAPGTEERKQFVAGFGVPGLLAIYQNPSGKAKEKGLAMAKACGFTRAGVIECTFEEETYEDLFGEQAVLCGGMAELIKAGFDTLVARGYPPEMAYFECLHETKLIMDLIYEGGIVHMWNKVSTTAQYGGLTRGKRLITAETKKEMKKILDEIESGQFSKEWIAEYDRGSPNLKRMKDEEAKHPIEKIGKEIREMFKKK